MTIPITAGRVPWRRLLVPTEHGVWGILGSAAVAGLIACPDSAGVAVVVAAIAGVIARHAVRETAIGQVAARTALVPILVVLVIALGSYAAALGDRWPILVPAAGIAAVLGLGHLGWELHRRDAHQRRPIGESMLGGAALASVASLVVIAGGGHLVPALVAGTVIAAYAITAPAYVRQRLRGSRGLVWLVALEHGSAATALLVLAIGGILPWLALIGFVPVLLRAVLVRQRASSPMALGIQELVVALGLAVCTGVALAGIA